MNVVHASGSDRSRQRSWRGDESALVRVLPVIAAAGVVILVANLAWGADANTCQATIHLRVGSTVDSRP